MPERSKDFLPTALLTAAAMIAFAANSLLCRMALGRDLIDAASFMSVRILSAALTLALITATRWRKDELAPDWRGVAALGGYMITFSFAYVTLSAGTGALLLFGAAQLTMLATAVVRGERFTAIAWLGVAIAFGGLVYLVAPGVTAPSPLGATLMTGAGVAWGVYSLVGRSATQPVKATAKNFFYTVPLGVLVSALSFADSHVTGVGVALALASGALASGIGYVLWYAALPRLKAGHAATVQLSVPVIAAVGGVLLLSEPASLRLAVATVLTLGGIWLVLAQRAR
jgi:drug/metabolite transporter (DMT)-like permease